MHTLNIIKRISQAHEQYPSLRVNYAEYALILKRAIVPEVSMRRLIEHSGRFQRLQCFNSSWCPANLIPMSKKRV